jgi:hypothetical protein
MKTKKIKEIRAKTFYASAVVGLQKGYSNEVISMQRLKKSILNSQKLIFEKLQVGLSIQITPCTILFLGQDEPSVTLSIIQYPKFEQIESILKKTFIEFIRYLMLDLYQNRIVIQFPDETILLEQSEIIDPKIIC